MMELCRKLNPGVRRSCTKDLYSSKNKDDIGKLSWERICLQCRRPQFNSCVRKICWRRERLPIRVLLGFPCGSAGKESTCNLGDLSLIPGLGRSPGERKSYQFQYSGLENYSAQGHKESGMTG